MEKKSTEKEPDTVMSGNSKTLFAKNANSVFQTGFIHFLLLKCKRQSVDFGRSSEKYEMKKRSGKETSVKNATMKVTGMAISHKHIRSNLAPVTESPPARKTEHTSV